MIMYAGDQVMTILDLIRRMYAGGAALSLDRPTDMRTVLLVGA